MLSIKNSLKYASGNIVCLLDGDDYFSSSKLNFIKNNFNHNDFFLNQDNLVGFNEKTQKKIYN